MARIVKKRRPPSAPPLPEAVKASSPGEELAKALTPLLHRGPPGSQGGEGDKGDKGDRGDKGDTGSQGSIGALGLTGPKGMDGLDGRSGSIGPKGDKGEKGEEGEKGEKGEKGGKGSEVVLGFNRPAAGGGGSGSMTTVKEDGTQVGGADIKILDFLGADFDITESPDKEINIVIASAIARDSELHNESHDYDTHTGGVPFAEVEYDDATSDPLIDADAAADGTEASAARKDHVHIKHHAKYTDAEALSAGQDDATSDPLIDGDAAADGTEESFARKDHVHPKHHVKYLDSEAKSAAPVSSDVIWDTAGDIAQADGADSAVKLALTAPDAGLLNVLGVANGETALAYKALFDATVPVTQAHSDAAAVGSALVAARRDHKHAMPAAGAGKFSYSITVEDPTSSEDISIAFTNRAITITEMRAVLIGASTPSVTWTIKHHASDRNNAGAAVVTASTTTTSTTTGSDVTSFNDATIPADSYIWLETSAQSGTVTEIHITIIGTED